MKLGDLQSKKTGPLLVLILMTLFFCVLKEDLAVLFHYDRASIFHGDLWRPFTSHLTHTGWRHLLLSVSGTLVVFALFGTLYSPLAWLTGLVGSMVATSAGLLLFCPDLEWYRGFSGVLHGLLAMGLVGGIGRAGGVYYLGLVLLLAKLLAEYLLGPSLHTSLLISAPVIKEAHLYGSIAGGVMACLLLQEKTMPGRSFGFTIRNHFRAAAHVWEK
ncbi:MAG: rhombosortase [Thermodesulfobacteriota bacterium]|nr:rhombosortase [Thermodesulfobacteriota bacterium]